MKYEKILHARFVSRPNRFIAEVIPEERTGGRITVHVKTTGRCRELLVPGARVILAEARNPKRRTAYDLVAVYMEGTGIVNIDSQAPNKAVHEWLLTQNFSEVRPEYSLGSSRIDFYMEKNRIPCLIEVKGCTLEIDGVGYFPDAPTERGIKHLKELSRAARQGYRCFAAFVIQMEGVDEVRPNTAAHPQFAEALADAEKAGVTVLCLGCRVTEDEMRIDRVFCPQKEKVEQGGKPDGTGWQGIGENRKTEKR